MSREIIYAKQFIDLQDGRYIPLVLHGSSNCTEFVNGREVLERAWSPLWRQETITQEELDSVCKDMGKDSDYEMYYEKGRWITEKSYHKWMSNCIKKALTLETIRIFRPRLSLKTSITIFHNDAPTEWDTHIHYCKTTEDILEALKEFDSIKTKSMYFMASFGTREGLSLGELTTPFIVAAPTNKGYLQEVCGSASFVAGPSKYDAKVFSSLDQFVETVPESIRGWGDFRPATPPIKLQRPYVLRRVPKYTWERQDYVIGSRRSHPILSSHQQHAKQFATEAAAKKFLETLDTQCTLEIIQIEGWQ